MALRALFVPVLVAATLPLFMGMRGQQAGFPGQSSPTPAKVNFVDIAARAGLTAKTEAGGEKTKKYIIETTGSGAAFFDYDNDGWPDIFLVNGTTMQELGKGYPPTSHLYHNNQDGTFTD